MASNADFRGPISAHMKNPSQPSTVKAKDDVQDGQHPGVSDVGAREDSSRVAGGVTDCFVSDRALAATLVGARQGQVYNNPHPASYLALQTVLFCNQPRWHTRCRPLRKRRLLALCIAMHRDRPRDGTRVSKEADMRNEWKAGMTSPRRVLVSDQQRYTWRS